MWPALVSCVFLAIFDPSEPSGRFSCELSVVREGQGRVDMMEAKVTGPRASDTVKSADLQIGR